MSKAMLQQGADVAETLDSNVAQNQASDPDQSVWVSAAAGTGKTKILADRVLRLLMPRADGAPGTPPHKILCLTFTKAGASEMLLRLNRLLGRWAVQPQEDLEDSLHKLLGRAPTQRDIHAARRLFADVTDAPGGLQIMTLHSFCQSVLRRFPLEAGLPPQFEVLEEADASALLAQARDSVLREAAQQKTSPLAQAVSVLARVLHEDAFFSLLRDIARERQQLQNLLQKTFGMEGVHAVLCKALQCDPASTPAQLLHAACQDQAFDGAALKRAAAALQEGKGKEEQGFGIRMAAWLSADPAARQRDFDDYAGIFLTTDGTPRSRGFPGKSTEQAAPGTAETLQAETARILALQDSLAALRCAETTAALLRTGMAVIERYQDLKAARAVLDFDDLIFFTLALLRGAGQSGLPAGMPGWVLFKLDQGIDHILIDEAQDTNPEQWQIVEALCAEFYAGQGARDVARSIFVVGDEKQSIYSFQRADPESFKRMQHDIAARVRAAGQRWDVIPLSISFRSTASVLKAVDSVFAAPAMQDGVSDTPIAHHAFRRGQAGKVEVWPLFTTEPKESIDLWDPPVTVREAQSGAAALAAHIAQTIRGWLDSGERLESQDRPVTPGDIMILVRTRNALFGQIGRALTNAGIPVSGVDRMILNDQIAVQDVLAIAAFALHPADDLTLAALLKSPLIGMSEDALYRLAAGRPGTLWEALRAAPAHKGIAAYLQQVMNDAARQSPFAFFSGLLQQPCPADSRSGWRAMMGRLGRDVEDALQELLSAALRHEHQHLPCLQGFLHWQSRNDAEIKRDLEEQGGQVRLMTVHGAKGLQAPIVIMPDTTRTAPRPSNQMDKRLLWPDKTGLAMPLFSPRADEDCNAYKAARDHIAADMEKEYRRLLYVAMTRAEDWLIIAGAQGRRTTMEQCWYNQIREGLLRLPDIEGPDKDGVLTLRNPQTRPPETRGRKPDAAAAEHAVPAWATAPAPPEPSPPSPLIPSRPDGDDDDLLSPLLQGQGQRFRRGILTHRLLQLLPELPAVQRQDAARRFLERQAADLDLATRGNILDETLAVLSHPDFAPIFGPGALAEVPVTGLICDRIVSGQIDRLLITQDEILIVDYKTNRPPPKNPADIPLAYRRQLQAYAAVLKQIYKDKSIRCALLWTDGPFLMPVPVAV